MSTNPIQTTDPLMQRVAKAIEDQMATEDKMPEDLARAAVLAMREPSPGMISAANRNNHPRDIDTWRTMIDTALREGCIP